VQTFVDMSIAVPELDKDAIILPINPKDLTDAELLLRTGALEEIQPELRHGVNAADDGPSSGFVEEGKRHAAPYDFSIQIVVAGPDGLLVGEEQFLLVLSDGEVQFLGDFDPPFTSFLRAAAPSGLPAQEIRPTSPATAAMNPRICLLTMMGLQRIVERRGSVNQFILANERTFFQNKEEQRYTESARQLSYC
jgi:hypothetical protein